MLIICTIFVIVYNQYNRKEGVLPNSIEYLFIKPTTGSNINFLYTLDNICLGHWWKHVTVTIDIQDTVVLPHYYHDHDNQMHLFGILSSFLLSIGISNNFCAFVIDDVIHQLLIGARVICMPHAIAIYRSNLTFFRLTVQIK